MISSLQSAYDMVILDAPPLNPVADAQVLLGHQVVHASIVIARVNKTSRDDVRRARAILDRQVVEPVGIVVTGLRETGGYGYGYGYAPHAGDEPSLHVSVDSVSAPSGVPSSGSSR